MRKLKHSSYIKIAFVALFLISTACDLNDPEEGNVPAYIYISDIQVETTSAQGREQHDIKDAWIYVNGNLIGAFELPALAPVLEEGTQNVSVRAGIIENGIANTRTFYPFFEFYDSTINMIPGNIDTISPVVSYNQRSVFKWTENFQRSDTSVERTHISDVDFEITDDPAEVYPTSEKSLKATLPSQGLMFEIASKEQFQIPRNQPVFLEVNFRTDVELMIGYQVIRGVEQSVRPFMYLNPTDEWKKLYVNFQPSFADHHPDSEFKIIFFARQYDEGPADIFLDNIKLIHFE
jgi:hypothetical protein